LRFRPGLYEQERKFVAAQTGDDFTRLQSGPQAIRHEPQQPVAREVAVGVVHRLEAIQVHEKQGQAASGAGKLGEG